MALNPSNSWRCQFAQLTAGTPGTHFRGLNKSLDRRLTEPQGGMEPPAVWRLIKITSSTHPV